MKIKASYDLENLITDYGFKRDVGSIVYTYLIDEKDNMKLKLLVGTADSMVNDRTLYLYYYNEVDDNLIVEEIIDYAVKLPNVLMKMILDGVVEE